jgi:hypothetical protein
VGREVVASDPDNSEQTGMYGKSMYVSKISQWHFTRILG